MIVSDCFQPLSAGNARNARAYTGHPLLTRAASPACDSFCKCILIALGMCWTKLMLCYNVLYCKVVSGLVSEAELPTLNTYLPTLAVQDTELGTLLPAFAVLLSTCAFT